jgi:hypothetical protein
MRVEGGASVACGSGLSCEGSTNDFTVAYTNPTDWNYGQAVSVTVQVSDFAGNVVEDAYSFTVESALGESAVRSVSTVVELNKEISSLKDGDTVVISPGTYNLTQTLVITADNVTVKGQSGDRTATVLRGDAMSSNASVKEIFQVHGKNFSVKDLTMERVGWHCIDIKGEHDADHLVVSNCVLRDSYEQLLKVSYNPGTPIVHSDYGLVENSLFEYSAGVGPQYYIGGIDCHACVGWVVRGNVFRNVVSPSGAAAEHAIHFWNGSKETLVEKNQIISCDRGIGFGLGGYGNTGGVIRNNMIYHDGRGSFADVQIGLEESPNSKVQNNTIYMMSGYPNAIEYRFASTTGVEITNNLTNKTIQARNGGSATLDNNLTNAVSTWFVDRARGDLHLASPVASVADQGTGVVAVTEDFDGQMRPWGAGIDIGADEYVEAGSLSRPRNVRLEK